MASGLSPLPSLGQLLHALDCPQICEVSQVPHSSRNPLQQRPRCLTELWRPDRLARCLERAEHRTGQGQCGSCRSRASLRRSGSYPLHAPLHPRAPSTRRASAQTCRACCSSICSRSQTLAPPLHRCPRPLASPTARLASQLARQSRPWCQHSSSRPSPHQRMHGMLRPRSTATQALSCHHRRTGNPFALWSHLHVESCILLNMCQGSASIWLHAKGLRTVMAGASSEPLWLQPTGCTPYDCGCLQCRALPKVQGPRSRSSDPSGYVMEDLLAHAVDNMRIKNVSKTQLARRAEQSKPSLLVSADMQICVIVLVA